MLDGLHDKSRLDVGQRVQPPEHFEHKPLVVLHIGAVHFEQIVERPTDVIAFGHFGDVAHKLGKVVGNGIIDPLQFDGTKHDKALIEFFGIEDGDIALDVATALQAADALVDGGWWKD